MRMHRGIISMVLIVAVVAIIVWDSGWAKRETGEAFVTRFGRVPQLILEQQQQRGMICGTFQFGSEPPGRFVYISHYSAGGERESLLIGSDSTFPAVAQRVCPRS